MGLGHSRWNKQAYACMSLSPVHLSGCFRLHGCTCQSARECLWLSPVWFLRGPTLISVSMSLYSCVFNPCLVWAAGRQDRLTLGQSVGDPWGIFWGPWVFRGRVWIT